MASTFVNIEIKGLKAIMDKCEDVDKAVRSVLGDAVLAGADIIRDDAKRRAPVHTGNLRKGIISHITWHKNATKAFAGVCMDPAMNTVFVKISKNGKRYYYPSSVEYGHKGTPAQPFMRPAMDKNKKNVKEAITSKVLFAITKAMPGGIP